MNNKKFVAILTIFLTIATILYYNFLQRLQNHLHQSATFTSKVKTQEVIIQAVQEKDSHKSPIASEQVTILIDTFVTSVQAIPQKINDNEEKCGAAIEMAKKNAHNLYSASFKYYLNLTQKQSEKIKEHRQLLKDASQKLNVYLADTFAKKIKNLQAQTRDSKDYQLALDDAKNLYNNSLVKFIPTTPFNLLTQDQEAQLTKDKKYLDEVFSLEPAHTPPTQEVKKPIVQQTKKPVTQYNKKLVTYQAPVQKQNIPYKKTLPTRT